MTITIPSGRTLPLQAKDGGGFASTGVTVSLNLSAPGVSGDFAEGQSITISPLSGESFGSGSTTDFYIGSNGKSPGDPLSASDAQVGSGIVTVTNPASWEAGGLSSKPRLRVNNPLGRLQIDYPATDELFMSAFVYIGSALTTFGASWKLFWVGEGADSFGTGDGYDLVMLTKTSFTDKLAFQGNDSNGTPLRTPTGFVPSGEWFHFSGWIKDNGASEMGVLCQLAKVGAAMSQQTSPDTPGQLMLSGTGSTSISRLNVMGDSNGDSALVDTWIDQLYISTGSNSRARVEIGDAENYTDCTALYPCTVSAWGADIEAKAWHPDPEGKYLHIHKGDGSHVAAGAGRLIS